MAEMQNQHLDVFDNPYTTCVLTGVSETLHYYSSVMDAVFQRIDSKERNTMLRQVQFLKQCLYEVAEYTECTPR